MHFIDQHSAWYLQMYQTAMGWLVRTKSIYKYVQLYGYPNCTHRIKWKEGKSQFPKNGDLTADDSTQSSTYIKTSTIEEKFQY